jgi:hypothetical protein
MYQNIYVKRTKTNSEVHLWDDKTGYSKFQYKPYAYLKSQSGTYRSLYGDKLKKVNFWTGDDLQNGRVFESDVPIETRTLVDMYPDSEEPSVGHREVYFDIECEVTDGSSESGYISTNVLVSIGISDSNTLPFCKSSPVQKFTFLSLSPYRERYVPLCDFR